MAQGLFALIVEPNANARGYLWQAILHEPQFRKVKGLGTLDESLKFMHSNNLDVVLISSNIPKEKISDFLAQARGLEGGREAAYINVIPEEDQTTDHIALNLIDGMDGFLYTPFSVISFHEVANISRNIKRKFDAERKKVALKMLLPKLSDCVDNFAVATMIKSSLAPEKKEELQTILKPIKKIAEEHKSDYIDILTDFFGKASPRTLPSYSGASERVKAIYEQTLAKVQ